MKKIFSKSIKKMEKGQSMIELAVSFVILLILLSGIIDVGRIAFYYIALRDSAQEGASYGSIFPFNCDEIEKRVKSGVVDSTGVNVSVKINNNLCPVVCPNNINVTCPVSVGNKIEVDVEDNNFSFITPILFGQTLNLKTNIKDNVIRVPECKCK